MGLKVGIVGLPNVGKSSLFNALTHQSVLVENRPFATIDPNLGIVKFLDSRLIKLADLVKPKKVIFSTIEFLDIAGLVKGASKGEGLGNKFLHHIRTVDAILLVARSFDNPEILSFDSKIDPVIDAETVLCELIYSDLEQIENIKRKLKSNDEKIKILEKIYSHLLKTKLISSLDMSFEEYEIVKNYFFLTSKPLIFLSNIDESKKSQEYNEKLQDYAKKMNSEFLSMNIKLENEISFLPEQEQIEFLKILGKEDNSLNRLVSVVFRKLNLKTFFTVGPEEVRSWNFLSGWTAPQCARCIHSDIERGFIKVKVAKYDDFLKYKNYKLLQENGKISVEGKDYKLEDGDIVKFEFNI